jgi:hypothetical protein
MDTNSYDLDEIGHDEIGHDEIGHDEIDLLASVGLNAELVFEGAGGYCPHCPTQVRAALSLSDAA